MKNLKKYLSIILAAAMVLTAAACGSSEETTDAGKADTTAAAESGDAEADVEKAIDFDDPNLELETLKFNLASIAATEGFDYTAANEYFSYWSEKLGIEWEVTALNWDNWATQLNTWIYAGDMPDWCIWNFDSVTGDDFVDQELLLKWPENWREKYPNLAAAADMCEYNAYYEEKYDGMYMFFKPLYSSNYPAEVLTQHVSLMIRRDWAEQAGYDLSKNDESGIMTFTEVFEYAQAIKDAGILEYPIKDTAQHIINMLGTVSEGVGAMTKAITDWESDEYYWGPAEIPTVKEYLGRLKEYYDEGLIYPDFYIDVEDTEFSKKGDSAVAFRQGDPASINGLVDDFKEYLGIDEETTMNSVAYYVLTDDEGVAHGEPNNNFWTCNILSPNLTDEEVDRILSFWDYSCRDDINIEMHLGIEGVDWEYGEDGYPVNLLENTEYGNAAVKYETQYPLYNMVALQGDDYMFVNPAYRKWSKETSKKLFLTRDTCTTVTQKTLDVAMGTYTSPNASTATLVYMDEYVYLMTQDGDFSANYDKWVEDNKAKQQLVVDDMNEYKASLGE